LPSAAAVSVSASSFPNSAASSGWISTKGPGLSLLSVGIFPTKQFHETANEFVRAAFVRMESSDLHVEILVHLICLTHEDGKGHPRPVLDEDAEA